MSLIEQPKAVSNRKIKKKIKNICNKCNKMFTDASKLRRHEISHNDIKQFECYLCQKLFKLQSSLQRHQQHNHQHIKKHKCSKCTASFAQRINLHIHEERLHRRRTNFKCSQCNCYFKGLNVLNRHKKAYHSTKSKSHANILNLEDDPNSLAELVVTQLKSLEHGISSLQTQETALPSAIANSDDAQEKPEEITFIEQAKYGETVLRVKLNPEKILETLKVQTVQRSKQRLAYVCEYCAKEFFKVYSLIRHLRTHTKERPYGCTVCSSTFTTKTQLEMHFKRLHVLDEETGFLDHQHRCCICFTNFSSMRKLDAHMKTHTEHRCIQYCCSVCGRKFGSKTAFSTHRHETIDKELIALEELLPKPMPLNFKHSSQIFTCSFCNLQQRTQQDLYRHQRQHELNKKYKCHTCGSSYLSKISLSTHQKLHQKKNDFLCTICLDRQFSTKSQLARHMHHVHNKQRDFQCLYCPQLFKTAAHCKSHMKTHLKSLLGARQQESIQDQATSSAAQIIIQEKNLTSNTAKFIQIEMLPRHPKFKNRNINVELATTADSSTKTQVSKYSCSYCEKPFQKPSDLKRHLRLHTQERPFNCDICNKSFKLKSTLEDHCKTHLSGVERGKTNVACQVCGKTYSTQKSLNVHLRIHTGDLPFKCENCGKSFRTSGHRLAHLKAAKFKNGNCIKYKNT